ncbi:integrase, catalytic region, zinc finger, CCHC-type containing protein [Tanacetum coccineum]
MHNNIMASGLRDRPPILAMRRYAQSLAGLLQEKESQLNHTTPEGSRFVTVVKQTVDLDKESYHKLFDILKQYQKEVNEIRAEKIARNANPLALVGTVTVVGARETVGIQVVQRTGIQCFNCKEFEHFAKECRKPKRAKDYTYHKEKMLLCKEAEKGVPLQAEQTYWLEDMDEEIDEQELEAHYSFMVKIQEVLPAESGANAETLKMVQHDAEYNVFANERKHSEQPESINNTHVVEKDDSNVIPDSSNMCDNDNQADQMLKILMMSVFLGKHTYDQFRASTTEDMTMLLKTCLLPLALKTQNDSFIFVNEHKQEMFADLQYVHSFEKEIDELESDKANFSNIYDLLLQECVSKDVMCSYLHSLSDLDAHTELQCIYLHKIKEYECIAKKLSKQTQFVSKEVYNELLRSFAKLEQHSIFLENALQQCQEQMKNDTVCKQNGSTVFLKEREQYFEIQYLKAQLQNKNIAISELKKLIEKMKGKTMDTMFDKPFVVQ